MAMELPILQKYFRLVGAFILVLGLLGGAAIYETAQDDPGNVIGYQLINGVAYPIDSRDSKLYRHDLERYGGKMAIVADEFANWFAGLWHGKSLGYTIAVLSIALSSAAFIAANHLTTDG
jgi:hypothetical protein